MSGGTPGCGVGVVNVRFADVPTTIRDMTHEDLTAVSDIERRSYEFPWSHGVFRDCLLAGYQFLLHIMMWWMLWCRPGMLRSHAGLW